MKLCSIDQSNSKALISTLFSNGAVYWEALEQIICEDESIDEVTIKDAAQACLDKMATFKNPRSQGKLVESSLVEIIHPALKISQRIAANPGFWRWVSLKYFFDVVQLRHAKPEDVARERNFGINGTLESLIGRVWFRGEIAHQPENDNPYELAKKGDQDFWRSHVLRKRYSNSREFIRALITFQYPKDENPLLNPSSEGGIRILTKRIQAAHASNVIELVDQDSLLKILSRLSSGLEFVSE